MARSAAALLLVLLSSPLAHAQGATDSRAAGSGARAAASSDAELAGMASHSEEVAVPEVEEDSRPYQAEPSRFQAGVRVGAELPMGASAGDGSLGDELSLLAPVWLDLTGRIGERLRVGGYVGTGLSVGKLDCRRLAPAAPSAPLCAFSLIRVGAQLALDLLRLGESTALWIGGGLGYEWSKLGAQYVPAVTDPTQLSGTEKIAEKRQGFTVLLQGGLDFHVFDDVRVGPYLTYLVSPATVAENECSGRAPCPADPDGTTFHGWLGVGVRMGVGF